LKLKTIFFLFLCFLLTFQAFLPRVYATEIFSDGFESGDFSAWDGTSDSGVAVETANPYQGSYNYESNCSGGGADANIMKLFTETAKVYGRIYFNIESDEGTSIIYTAFMEFSDSSWHRLAALGYNYASRNLTLKYYNNSGAFDLVSSQTLEVNKWYCLEVEYYSADAGEVKVWLDGTEVSDLAVSTNNSLYKSNRMMVGIRDNWRGDVHIDFDCVVIDTEYIGPISSSSSVDIGEIESSVSTAYYGENFNLSAVITSSSNTDFTNATLNLGSNIILGWTNSTNNFYKVSDPSNYVQLYDGSKTVVNSSSLRLTWIINFFNTFPEGYVDVDGTVFDGSGNNATESATDVFYVTSKPQGGSSSPSPTPTPSPEPSGETPFPPQPDVPVAPSAGTEVPAGVVIAVCCFAAAGYLLYHDRSLRRFKSLRATRQKWKRKLGEKDLEIVWEKIKEWE